MEDPDDSKQSWRLFTFEDMIQGFKSKSVRKRKTYENKENVSGNSSNRFTYPLSPSFSETRDVTPTSRMQVNQESHSRRSPLSTITNCNASSAKMSHNLKKDKSKKWMEEAGRVLFREENDVEVDHRTILADDEIECTTNPAPVFSDDSSTDDDYYPTSEDDADTENEEVFDAETEAGKPMPKDYASLGSPDAICSKCSARMWKEERVNKNVTKGTPIFSTCCKKGDVKLPPSPPTPAYLLELYNCASRGAAFEKNIRLYNAMFAFTSSGGNVDHSINNGRGPYVYRLNGQNHHVFGQLIPDDGEDPKFCQLYIYDTVNEVNNRLRWVNVADNQEVDEEVVQGLIEMLDQTNSLVAEFRMARDRFENDATVDLKVELKVCRAQSGRENHFA